MIPFWFCDRQPLSIRVGNNMDDFVDILSGKRITVAGRTLSSFGVRFVLFNIPFGNGQVIGSFLVRFIDDFIINVGNPEQRLPPCRGIPNNGAARQTRSGGRCRCECNCTARSARITTSPAVTLNKPFGRV